MFPSSYTAHCLPPPPPSVIYLSTLFGTMDKVKLVKNGVIRLPPGFRFHPTDEELVVQYLKRKVLSSPLPASIIPDFDVCRADPWDLPGNIEKERYFFSTREAKYPNGNRSNRATGSGYWKATGIDKRVVTSRGNQIVGLKKTLVFYKGKPPHGLRTDWIMHEYRLSSSPLSSMGPTQNWVLCRIFLKKRAGNKSDEDDGDNRNIRYDNDQIEIVTTNQTEDKTKPIFFDFMRKERTTDLNLLPSSSSSDHASSGLTTEIFSSDEETSSCNSFRRNL
ncbi:unnamed protein product [Brassica oleracea var. botrytis]|uniref:BnaC09g43890D protein n=5 Tax=Brassica TaxID=3705 RepID=A0A078F9L0_BRANA|nr:PREDICTED: NAC domain-containing protein 83 [Brassica oleracea var. oleracea]XP_013667953.1 NAC domain-containing protein 83 [Brassica napus]VDD33906.1 unnamed protein product [Brassica oleracea]KAH0860963.1 hypothetical protein HID58_089224 [Brassica napus]CAF1785776.1 unnamed protein product [Brassica napus]CDY09772.1 BnaC09g43890D [Brassica napus]